MKIKVVGLALAAMVLISTSSVSQAANSDAGGAKGFLTGCCFGVRVGADYNELGTGNRDFLSWFLVGCVGGVRAQEDYKAGKDITFRDWGRIIPLVGIIFPIWDGVDTMNGTVRGDLRKTYGSSYY